MKRLIISILTLLLIVPLALAQGKVRVEGHVVSAFDGDAIFGVTILVLDEQKEPTKQFCLTDENGFFSIDVEANHYLKFSSIGYYDEIIPVNNQTGMIKVIMALNGSSTPSEFYTDNCFTLGGLATYNQDTWGYVLDASINMRYWSSWKHREKIRHKLAGSYGLYNNIMKHSSLGVRLTKLNPSDNKLLPSIYYRFSYVIPIRKYNANISLFANAGLYLEVDRREIQSHNLEYGGGVQIWNWNAFLPIMCMRRSDFLRNIKLLAGYRGYNKRSEYNHFYLGLSFTFPQKVIIYE